MEFSAGNAQHIGTREQQQDSFGFSDPSDKAFVRHGGFVGVVADGMGGLANGQVASATAVSSFLQAYQGKLSSESVTDALLRSLLRANEAVLRIAADGSGQPAGTTLVATAVLEEEFYWIAVGDSRIYWLHDGEPTQLTSDHVYAAMLNRQVALGTLSRSDAGSDPERAALTSYLGHSALPLIDRNVRPLRLHGGDSVVLCSDGFYRALSLEEITDDFRGNPQSACDSLVELALTKQRRHQDNLTVIALKASHTTRLAGLQKNVRALSAATVCLIALLTSGGLWMGNRARQTHASPPASSAPSSQKPTTVSHPTEIPSAPPPAPNPAPTAPASVSLPRKKDETTGVSVGHVVTSPPKHKPAPSTATQHVHPVQEPARNKSSRTTTPSNAAPARHRSHVPAVTPNTQSAPGSPASQPPAAAPSSGTPAAQPTTPSPGASPASPAGSPPSAPQSAPDTHKPEESPRSGRTPGTSPEESSSLRDGQGSDLSCNS